MTSQIKSWISIMILVLAIVLLCYHSTQSDFSSILLGYSLAYFGYILLVSDRKLNQLKLIHIAAIVILPVIALFNFPNLSDDIYRFVWDGYLVKAGINPYRHLPSDIVGQFPGLTNTLFDALNSKEYFSIYPTVSQGFFYLITLLSSDIHIQASLLKLIYLCIHIIGFKSIYVYFKKRKLNSNLLLLYFANPLVIIEGIGNLHAEINMVSFLFIALYFWDRKQDWFAALFLSFAISVKLLPILFLGYFIFRLQQVRIRHFLLKTITISTLLALPVIYGIINGGFLDSIDLYLRKFEFNASIYYVLRYLGMQISGYNLIAYLGPFLLITFITITWRHLYITRHQNSLANYVQSNAKILTIYFFLATIIHPWYIIGLLGLNIFLDKKYILAWSYLATLTYINYSYMPYNENLWIVFLEYIIVIPLFLKEMVFTKGNQ